MSWLDTPEEDRAVFLYNEGAIIAVGRPRHVFFMWGDYNLILDRVKIPSEAKTVLVHFWEFDKIVPGKMLFDRDRFPETGWTPTGEREFRREC